MQLLSFYLLFTFIKGFNTSQEDPDPSRFPYVDSDLVSPTQDASPTVILDIFSSAHKLQTESVRQGGGDSGLGDKTRFHVVPQEISHNGQDKAGSVISDLAHTDTHSLTDSRLSFTEKEKDSSLFSAETQWTGLSAHTLNVATSADSNTGANTLPENGPRTTTVFSVTHVDTNTPSLHSDVLTVMDITVMSSAPMVSQSHITTHRNRATVTELVTSESNGFRDVTDGRDTSVMSSSFTANEGRPAVQPSSKMFWTKSLPHPNHMTPNYPDLSVTDGFLSDSVSHLQASESNSITYVSDGTVRSSAYKDTAETDRFPRSTRINRNVSGHTASSRFDDVSTTTDPPRASLGVATSTLSDMLENISTTNRKRTEFYSHTPYYTSSPNTDSTPTESETPQASHTEYTSIPVQTTNHQRSDSVTSMRQDFTSTPASHSPHTLTHGDPINSHTVPTGSCRSVIATHQNDPNTTLGPITAPYGTTDTDSLPVSELQTQTDNNTEEITEMNGKTSDSNNLPHVTALNADTQPTMVTHHDPSTSRNDPETTTTLSPAVTPASLLTSRSFDTVTTSTPSANLHTAHSTLITTTRRPETRIPNHLTTSRNTQIVQQPETTTTHQVHTNTHTNAETHTHLTPVINQTSWSRTFTKKPEKDWSHKGRVFIMEDQPAIIKEETFQVLLQVILEENSPTYAGLLEVEPFLQNVSGYQSQHVTWHSGPVVQFVVTFRTVEAVSWLERAGSLLQEAGLKPLPTGGVFVSGIQVKNITVGGLHSDVCSWLFSCPSDFSCVSSDGNVTCKSVCHSEYCKNHGICVHRSEQNPVCQCPVGEDFWFMGQRCDLRMTRQRLAGLCSGVLAAIAALMGLLAYLAVQRFKKMLIQAKAEQTQSSYRRFNHFDELSARFWRRSWPGSQDSLDNTAFSHSDELLHMRALDQACCYHDDTLSLASTYPDSVTHLNTVYPHSSQYHWDMSTCSLADGVIDSGKASDLSVCSWPIEPIQWTPFPLLQQLRHTNTMKPSRPRSYCEGMELVGLEKSRTA
ncbi:hypothetical protein Q7C36_021658 [Tachysurus vachellii]|uniref:EGF-like domain-containing protein n=1 Tax=Tachysurus vachellii TaxID=175792 RepID=A0AA88INE4_TACVA|nr:hypothetical protein Q7C36_021658 [Tachysurus vachellii]